MSDHHLIDVQNKPSKLATEKINEILAKLGLCDDSDKFSYDYKREKKPHSLEFSGRQETTQIYQKLCSV
jgi:hypothetical protein